MHREFTSSVYIIETQRVLLIWHRKLKKWLPPGGHLEPNELPSEAAKREAFEETGLEIKLLSQENLWVERWNANSFERPYMCLVVEFPEQPGKPAHQHIDLVYVGTPVGGKEKENLLETDGLKWFTLNEVEGMRSDEEIFGETKTAIRTLLQFFPNPIETD